MSGLWRGFRAEVGRQQGAVLQPALHGAERSVEVQRGVQGLPARSGPTGRERGAAMTSLEAAERVVDGAGIETVNASDLQALVAALKQAEG